MQCVLGGERTIRRYRQSCNQFESTPTDERNAGNLPIFRGLGYSGVQCWETRTFIILILNKVPHYKFGLGGHRDFLFFRQKAVGTNNSN